MMLEYAAEQQDLIPKLLEPDADSLRTVMSAIIVIDVSPGVVFQRKPRNDCAR